MSEIPKIFVGVWIAASLFCARPADAAQLLQSSKGPYAFEVFQNGQRVPTFYHKGQSYVLGQTNQRYTIRVHNHSPHRVEAVVSVDGLDVLDGKKANFSKRGYLISAWSFVDIDGWRTSDSTVSAFRFSSVARSYAARTSGGRNVGVIGVAIFPEYRAPAPVVVPPRPYPMPEPRYEYDEQQSLGESRAEDSAAEAEAAPSPSQGYGSGMRAKSSSAGAAPKRRSMNARPGLGTAFGETHYSSVQHVSFSRANWSTPVYVLGARYNDRAGLIALGIDVDRRKRTLHELRLRQSASPFSSGYATPPSDWEYR